MRRSEEFVASFGDDDVQYVGTIDAKTGFFTPASDGPNPKRKSQRNNYGDVWAVAQFTPQGSEKTNRRPQLLHRCRASVHAVGSTGGGRMTLSRSEVHTFRGVDYDFAYLVPSGGIIALDNISTELLARLEKSP